MAIGEWWGKMKIIFDKKEEMDKFLDNEFCYIGLMLPDVFSGEWCHKHQDCRKCLESNIEITYVKDCTECMNYGSCNTFYRSDMINEHTDKNTVLCNPRAK